MHRSFPVQERSAYSFDCDYLLYAIEGSIRLYLGNKLWILPPAFAAWLPRNTNFEIELRREAVACSALYRKGYLSDPIETPVIFPMNPLGRELLRYCQQWRNPRGQLNEQGRHAFRILAGVCKELTESPSLAWKPVATHPIVEKAIHFTIAHIEDDIKFAEVARVVGTSERSLMRYFQKDIGMTWSGARRRFRIVMAIEHLASGNRTVAEVALCVGYRSLSAFNRAFREITGDTPAKFSSYSSAQTI